MTPENFQKLYTEIERGKTGTKRAIRILVQSGVAPESAASTVSSMFQLAANAVARQPEPGNGEGAY